MAVCNPEINPANNRLSSSGWEYDAAGNTIQDAEGRSFIYNGENKQTEVRSAQNQVIGKYYFDGDGKRVKKISATERTIFVYNAVGQLVAEYSNQIEQNAKTSYLTQDHLGSPRILTDQNGAVISRRDFAPFGEELGVDTPLPTGTNGQHNRTTAQGYVGADSIRQRFTGYERDAESSLDFAQARMYGFSFGRFTSPDPLQASASANRPQSWNRYSYSYNNPLRYTDPSGMTAGDFYDRKGDLVATDGIDDKKIYLLNEGVNIPCGTLNPEQAEYAKKNAREVGGLIILTRTEEGKDYTSGEFRTVGGGNKDVQGVTLEPAGPDTTKRGQDRRVPEGVYDLQPHSGQKHKDTFVISNSEVSKDRAILFHRGYSGSWTEGCILPGGGVKNGRITAGTSEPKMAELKVFIQEKGADNVKLIIRNRIRNKNQ